MDLNRSSPHPTHRPAAKASNTGALTDLRHDVVLEGQAAGVDELVEGADEVGVTGVWGRKQVGIHCSLLAHLAGYMTIRTCLSRVQVMMRCSVNVVGRTGLFTSASYGLSH